MDITPRSNNNNSDDNSLGILSMDNLKVFGDLSSICNGNSNCLKPNKHISERLNAERLMALEMLEKAQSKEKKEHTNRMNRNSTSLEHSRSSVANLNISDWITDETIHLNSTEYTPVTFKQPRISFEPTEITGRSTLFKYDYNCKTTNEKKTQGKKVLSVGEILASSFAEKARKLSEKMKKEMALRQQEEAAQQKLYEEALRSNRSIRASLSSTLSSLTNGQSLPRTADISLRSQCESLNGGESFSFNIKQQQQEFNESNFSALAEFVPGELMQSKLILDEISWANEFAAIPTVTLSNQAKDKVAKSNANEIETSVSNSAIAGDPDFSVGSFFRKRSDSLLDFAGTKSPDKYRIPSALVDEVRSTNNTACISKSMTASDIITPKVDNKTYTKLERNLIKNTSQTKFAESGNKEKLNIDNPSFMLSLSAIDRVLRNLDLDTDTSPSEVVNKLLGQGQKPLIKPAAPFVNLDTSSEEKENVEPTLISVDAISDTKSFSESLMNSTDLKQFQQSISAPRTPLSPLIDLTKQPQINIVVDSEDGHEADIDDWPSTPVKSPHRRVRRTKSPNAVSPTTGELKVQQTVYTDDDQQTPVNKKINNLDKIYNPPKSLSSTRLDGRETTPELANYVLGISPNLSKSATTSTAPNDSPTSSPYSCLSSPQLDSTANSERRLLQLGMARKMNSSPASSESSSVCAAHTFPSRKAVAARSTSRCSNSSEFSHRDGKLIPLKVTHLQLCWNSTKLRTDVRKATKVKNIGDKRLVVRIVIHGPGFQLVNVESNSLTLQSQECRTISVNFCPTVIGAAVGMLSFYSPLGTSNANASLLDIPLFGYGGNAMIGLHGLLKGPVGSSFLPLGDVCELSVGPLKTAFCIYNKGPLPGYINITVDSTVLMKPRLSEAFEVLPNKAVLPSGSELTVEIIFKPNRDDIKNILKKTNQVLTLANMRVIYGDEPNRQRMRALLKQMNKLERCKLSSTMLDNLWHKFPGEQEFSDLSELKERSDFLIDLMTAVRISDVSLTLNHDFNESAETSSLFFPDADDSILFRTVCAVNSPTPSAQMNLLEPVDELLEADATIVPETNVGSWSVQPSILEFNAGNHNTSLESVLNIKNYYKSQQCFDILCSSPRLLHFTPNEGYVAPDGGQVNVKICAVKERVPDAFKKEVFVTVCMENERIKVPVQFNI